MMGGDGRGWEGWEGVGGCGGGDGRGMGGMGGDERDGRGWEGWEVMGGMGGCEGVSKNKRERENSSKRCWLKLHPLCILIQSKVQYIIILSTQFLLNNYVRNLFRVLELYSQSQ